MKNNRNIIFTKANKGNITVAMNKIKYTSEIMRMLNDTETYIKIMKNPINALMPEGLENCLCIGRKRIHYRTDL